MVSIENPVTYAGLSSSIAYSYQSPPLSGKATGFLWLPAKLTPSTNGIDTMPNQHSLPDVLEKIYENQLALEAAIMELSLAIERQGDATVGENVREALSTIEENVGQVTQALKKLKTDSHDQ